MVGSAVRRFPTSCSPTRKRFRGRGGEGLRPAGIATGMTVVGGYMSWYARSPTSRSIPKSCDKSLFRVGKVLGPLRAVGVCFLSLTTIGSLLPTPDLLRPATRDADAACDWRCGEPPDPGPGGGRRRAPCDKSARVCPAAAGHFLGHTCITTDRKVKADEPPVCRFHDGPAGFDRVVRCSGSKSCLPPFLRTALLVNIQAGARHLNQTSTRQDMSFLWAPNSSG